jgi:hypothetical protein
MGKKSLGMNLARGNHIDNEKYITRTDKCKRMKDDNIVIK